MRKNTSPRRPALDSHEQLDQLLLAMAFVISRRQMRGKWTRRFISSIHNPA
jgi:hypothetical protein